MKEERQFGFSNNNSCNELTFISIKGKIFLLLAFSSALDHGGPSVAAACAFGILLCLVVIICVFH